MEERLPRKLAVILHADVVGYSRLAGEDEDATHRQLRQSLDLIFELVEGHRGRVVNTAGDAVLAMFEAGVDAVSCAVAIQKELRDSQTIQFRIGINIGDIIEDGGDIYGDGVNVAARLEGLAEPGGICVSESVYTSVGITLPVKYKDIGEQTVKNIERPIRAYLLLIQSESEPSNHNQSARSTTAAKTKKWPVISAIMAAALIAAVGIVYWSESEKTENGLDSKENISAPQSDIPSIAVLPFDNLSDDSEQEYFADGMTEDLITDLSKLSNLFVISRNTTFTYKGKAIKIEQVAQELNVRYVLEGSVRRAGNQVRINAQLIDGESGGHLWAERYDGTLDDVFALQDKITNQIVQALSVTLSPQEVESLERTGTTNSKAYDAYLLGLSYFHQGTPDDNRNAMIQFKKAIELDAGFSLAYTALAKVYASAILQDYQGSRSLGISWKSLIGEVLTILSNNSIEADVDYYVVQAWLALRKRQHPQAIDSAKQALSISPNNSDALEAMSEALIFSGKVEDGLHAAQMAIRQNPAKIGRSTYLMGIGEYIRGDSGAAINLLEKAIARSPERIEYSGILAAAYADQNQLDQAKAAFLRYAPSVSGVLPGTNRVLSLFPAMDRDVVERYFRNMISAGVTDNGYIPLYQENRLNGDEIRSLLFGANISGIEFWLSDPWSQKRNSTGKVEHSGSPVINGVPYSIKTGFGRIEGDLLCERWPEFIETDEICVSVYRMLDDDSVTTRRGDYILLTDVGPNPFRVVE